MTPTHLLACPRAQPAPTTHLRFSLPPLHHLRVPPDSQTLALNPILLCHPLAIMLPWSPPHPECSRLLGPRPLTHSFTLGEQVGFYLDPLWGLKGAGLSQLEPLVGASSTPHPLPPFLYQVLG